jgi:hypothetical protein
MLLNLTSNKTGIFSASVLASFHKLQYGLKSYEIYIYLCEYYLSHSLNIKEHQRILERQQITF